MSITLLGEVERVTYENEETGFRVLRLGQVEGLAGKKRVTVIGVLPAVGVGTRVRVAGDLEDDPKRGEQLRARSLVVVEPETLAGLEKYLGSGIVPGVGPKLSQRIVAYFGADVLLVLDTASHRLLEIPGLGQGRVDEIRRAWVEHRTMSNVLLALQSHGVSPALARRFIERFGDKTQEVVEKHPYRLAIEIAGVGFKTADRIARAQGIAGDHPERAQAGVLHELGGLADSGHCLCQRGLLVERTAMLLDIGPGHVEAAIDALEASERVVVEGDLVFLAKLHRAERDVTAHVARLLAAPQKRIDRLDALLEQFEGEKGIQLAEAQRRAVLAAAHEKVVVITGGPGVGKTTIVEAILFVLEKERLRIRLAAPTGRAAKRLAESTGKPATTLHRLLEVEGKGGHFQKNEKSPLEADLLVVDEVSMVDLPLMASLLAATPSAARLVLVGDADQLPSVGPGSVLRDLIESQVVPVVRLEVIFRQAGQSGIVENSHRILRGEEPVGATDPSGDFFVIFCKEPDKAAELVRQVVTRRIPERFGLEPLRDVQVLTPMHRGAAGTLALNESLQSLLNPSGAQLPARDTPPRPNDARAQGGEVRLRAGDKVIQIKNDYDKDVFNGDVGEIAHVDAEKGSVEVLFEGVEAARRVTYEKSELGQLLLAYALSIHKSQGSEYPAVVIPLLSEHFVMLSRNLLYTAVTRAKRLCVLVCDRRALRLALAETRKEERQTYLKERLVADVGRCPGR